MDNRNDSSEYIEKQQEPKFDCDITNCNWKIVGKNGTVLEEGESEFPVTLYEEKGLVILRRGCGSSCYYVNFFDLENELRSNPYFNALTFSEEHVVMSSFKDKVDNIIIIIKVLDIFTELEVASFEVEMKTYSASPRDHILLAEIALSQSENRHVVISFLGVDGELNAVALPY